MITADLNQSQKTAPHAAAQIAAVAKTLISDGLHAAGIEDATDLATRIGYLVVGAYGVAMIINLAGLY